MGRSGAFAPAWRQKYSAAQACRIYGAATYSFLWTPSLDLTPYVGKDTGDTMWKVILTDGSAKTATAYFGAQGAGETLGAEAISNTAFETDTSGWYTNAVSFARSNTQAHGGTYSGKISNTSAGEWPGAGVINLSLTTSALYKYNPWHFFDSAGTETIYSGVLGKNGVQSTWADGTTITTSGHFSTQDAWANVLGFYVTAGGYTNYSIFTAVNNSQGAIILYLDDCSFKPVTDGPATYSLHVMTAQNGTTRGWTVDSGFNYNAATHTVTIYHWE